MWCILVFQWRIIICKSNCYQSKYLYQWSFSFNPSSCSKSQDKISFFNFKLPVPLKLYVRVSWELLQCRGPALCHYGTGQNVASPQAKWQNLSGATVLTWANSAQRKCPTYCFWKLGYSPSPLFRSLHDTFFLGHHKCNFNNRLPSIIIPIGSILAVAAARVLVSD